jgi:SAM-dependent methyltransferase
MSADPLDVERAVSDRYSAAARSETPELCCKVDYDPSLLEAIPDEVLKRDYGCGDPTRYVRSGETVLDLGSGGGKACFMAAQVVGPAGQVIGVDMNDDMLALAEKHRPTVGKRLGYDNVRFLKGKIQDLAIADESIDVVVSNCVLNLVRNEDKRTLFREIHRVLRPGGRAVIADIVSERDVPAELQADPELWSGCISGALREDRFREAFSEAGFHSVKNVARDDAPWRTVEGIEFRSLTVEALKSES